MFLDTETSALPDHRDYDRLAVTQIGAVAFEVDSDAGISWVIDTFEAIVRPVDGCLYDPFSLRYQKTPGGMPVTLEWLEENGVDETDAMYDLGTFLMAHVDKPYAAWGPSLWSQNADFDHGFLLASNRRTLAGLSGDLNLPMFSDRCDWSCTRKLFTLLGSLGAHDEANPSMKTIRRVYGLPDEAVHTALGDAHTGVRALAAMSSHLRRVLA